MIYTGASDPDTLNRLAVYGCRYVQVKGDQSPDKLRAAVSFALGHTEILETTDELREVCGVPPSDSGILSKKKEIEHDPHEADHVFAE